MPSLPERLREQADLSEKSIDFLDDELAAYAREDSELLREAADELERLDGHLDCAIKERQKAEAEIERLKAELRDYKHAANAEAQLFDEAQAWARQERERAEKAEAETERLRG